ncbi:MAG TPA: Spy/CpxP family protein refolding chaperone, partial [Verrucomicrobiae bacterium]|nr:Spy/CpxP family protein refolding chaperone [Verrucomicrobiae bacterium]
RAQLNTIAFDGLAFLTGGFNEDTFLPPGKISDFFGFQNMRDVDVAAMGHNTDFLTRIADNTLNILNDQQKDGLVELGKSQAPRLRELALKRFPLIQAYRRNLSGDLPVGSAGLDREAIMKYTADNFELGGQLAFERAEAYGKIIRSLTPQQQAQFAALKFGDSSTWPDVPRFNPRGLPHAVHVAMMTYASEFFSWYAGSVESDTYFCPEGHGTYFGSFYLKDAPAVHQRNYSISTRLTGDSGEAFLNALTPAQRQQIEDLVDLQRQDLQDIVATRRAAATELRKFFNGDTADKDKVLALCRHYGALDGELSCYYATHFAAVNKTLTAEQRAVLKKLRGIEGYTATQPFVYADPVAPPTIPNTDFLFTAVH